MNKPRPRTSPTRDARRPRRSIDRGVTLVPRRPLPQPIAAHHRDRGPLRRQVHGVPEERRCVRAGATSAASPPTARGPRTTQGRHRSLCPRSSGPARRRCAPRPTAGRSARTRTGSRRTRAGSVRVAERAEALQEPVRRDDDPAVALDGSIRIAANGPTPDAGSSIAVRTSERTLACQRRTAEAHAATDRRRGRAGSAPRHPGRPSSGTRPCRSRRRRPPERPK